MKDHEVIGYVCESEYTCAQHCPEPSREEQDDGHVTAVFAGDEQADAYHCRACYAEAHPRPAYLDLSRVTGYRETDIPRVRRRQDGYGTLVPGAFLLQIDGKRWHRVRTTCWSNRGTDFVRVAGQLLILEGGWHHSIERSTERA